MVSFKVKFKQFRNDYVINQVARADIPELPAGAVHRYRVRFSGRVQRVGFRLEVCELAKRLELTGWCRNLDNGDVLAEIQGPTERIDFLISFMESLKRIKIRNKAMEEIDVISGETGFEKQ